MRPCPPAARRHAGRHVRLAVGLAAVAASGSLGCRALFGHAAAPQAAPPEVYEEASADADAGVNRASALLRQFGAQLGERDFDAANATLGRIERGLAHASEVTRAHPDFDDLAERIAGARPRLVAAIEADRVERREAAIDALIRRGELAMHNGATALAEVHGRSAQDDDVAHLDEAGRALAELVPAGEAFTDAPRYARHAAARQQMATALAGALALARQQLAATAAVVPAIEAGIAAANRAKTAPQPAEQLAAYQQVVDAFAACANALGQRIGQPGFDPHMPLETRLGRLDASRTQAACAETSRQGLQRVHRFAWESAVKQRLAAVQAALTAFEAAADPAAREAAAVAATEALRACENDGQIVTQQPGFDPKLAFATPFGAPLAAAAIVARCGAEGASLAAQAPRLHWRTEAAALEPRLTALQQRLDEAARIGEPAAQAEAYSAVAGGLQECRARSHELAQATGADRSRRLDTPWGLLTVEAIAQHCGDAQAGVDRALSQALGRAQAAAFTASCRGDEVEVVRREGVPPRIDALPQGRIFVYPSLTADKAAAPRRFGFNERGERVDFTVQWRGGVEALLQQMQALLPGSRGSGQVGLSGLQAALPVWERCQAGTITDQHPGHDPTALFDTPYGRLHAEALRRACAAELPRLRARLDTVSWQARLEVLRDRAEAALQQLTEGKQQGDAEVQARQVGAAVGGLSECAERAATLARAAGADARYQVEGSLGKLRVGELERACRRARDAAAGSLEQAVGRLRLQQFVQTCHGDEAEVAGREGIPGRVEAVGPGRVFVFGGRRIAFDANGHRTEERLLRGP